MKNDTNEKLDSTKEYTLEEAVTLLPSISKSKFVGSVDLDVVLKLKEAQRKEVIRGNIDMPNTFGESKKVIVFCEEGEANNAVKAGADRAGLEELMKDVMDGKVEFDVVISTPSVMPKIARLGKVLGPKGLMPNPKNGTVTTDFDKAVKSFKSGRTSFKSAQDQGVIRLKVGKLDMGSESIQANVLASLKAILGEARKFSANPFKKVSIKPTMGSSLKLDVNDIMKQL